MTVGELIESLKQYDLNQKVYITENTGNYWRDVVAYETEYVCTETVKYSEYSRALKIIKYGDGDENTKDILVIQ